MLHFFFLRNNTNIHDRVIIEPYPLQGGLCHVRLLSELMCHSLIRAAKLLS